MFFLHACTQHFNLLRWVQIVDVCTADLWNRAINLWTNSFHENNIVQKNANAVVKSAFVFEINNENACSVLVQFAWLVMEKFFCSIKSIDVLNGEGGIVMQYPWCSSQSVFPYTWGGVSNIRNCTKEGEPNWNALYKKLSPWTEKIIPRIRVSDAAIVLATAGVDIIFL